MGADVLGRARYMCAHGCQIGGACPEHEMTLWYREGFVYLVVDGQPNNYRDAPCFDVNQAHAMAEILCRE